MKLPLSIDLSTVAGIAIGSFISAIAGLTAALYGDYLRRREYHRLKLLDNLRLIRQALWAMLSRVWPPIVPGGYENAGLPLPIPFGLERNKLIEDRYKEIERLKITTITNLRLPIKLTAGNEEETSEISFNLYHDLKHHFESIYKSLSEFEIFMQTSGAALKASYYDLVLDVFDRLKAKGLLSDAAKGQVMTRPFEVRQNTPLAVQIIFNLSLGIPPEKWPSLYENYYKDSLDRPLIDEIVSEVTSGLNTKQISDNVNSMLTVYTQLLNEIDRILESDTRLRGRCMMTSAMFKPLFPLR